ncbi:sigma 54-interacting transcriptional regulator [Synechococcus elongatus IITB4]|uniref:sigma 54-interacting transcriptional regulator n=1 Tax=Synechococcus elongatus TaxID=32046 RepID=UPI0030CBECD3
METIEKQRWLAENTLFSGLSERAITAIATELTEVPIESGQLLIDHGTVPTALFILVSGELDRQNPQTGTCDRLLPGSVLNLQEILLRQPINQRVTTAADALIWQLSADQLRAIAADFSELDRHLSVQLAAALDAVTAQLQFEQARLRELQPYVVPKMRRGIVGSSRYAQRLRQDIRQAAARRDRQPVLIFGEPGLGKDNIAALIHFGSRDRREPLIKINCNTLQPNGIELFGRANERRGLLDWVGKGTVLLNNVQELPADLRSRVIELLATGYYRPLSTLQVPEPEPHPCLARLILVAETNPTDLARHCVQTIKVPPLRIRKADIVASVKYFLSRFCQTRRQPRPKLTPEAERQLQNYDYPGNITELESLVERALVQSGQAAVLTEDVFWFASTKGDRFRWNLLNAYPRLRQLLRSDWWPTRINYGLILGAYTAVVFLLFLGPQTRAENLGLTLFWAGWWPLILLAFPFVGRLWCAYCPFMIYGELVQWISLKLWPRSLLPWPRAAAERWGGWFLFGLFALILLWEELWNLEDVAWLSACLLLLITAGAVTFSLLFERRFWCRYLCPIGGMNGLFAKLAVIELRAKRGVCSATCNTYQCYKGGPEKGEGQETMGCPVYSHPAQLVDNRNCVLCMTCLKACPHRSVELNLRPPAIELWTTHVATRSEASLLFLLLGAVFLHHLPQIAQVFGLGDRWLTSLGLHAILATAVLGAPGLLAFFSDRLLHLWQPRLKSLTELAYGYLPLVLAASVAHYLWMGLTELGQILPRTALSFGWPSTGLLQYSADPAVIAFLQASSLILGLVATLLVTQKIARQPWRSLLPQHGLAVGFTSLLWQLIV